jgi:hypothetical protein
MRTSVDVLIARAIATTRRVTWLALLTALSSALFGTCPPAFADDGLQPRWAQSGTAAGRSSLLNQPTPSQLVPGNFGDEIDALLASQAEETEGTDATVSQQNEQDPIPDEPIGQAPQDNRLLFLRTAAPLLKQGESQFDFGIRYQWREFNTLALLPGNRIGLGRVRTRKLTVPFAARYGYTDRLQLFASLPVGYANLELATGVADEFTRIFGTGDLTTGFNYLLREESGDYPAMVGSMNVTVPLAADPFERSPGPAALGDGFWGVAANLLWIKTIDPAVIFYGVGYQHQFDRSFGGFDVDPGEAITYQFGTGFAINDTLSLTGSFFGAYRGPTKFNGRSAPFTHQEPFLLRFSLVHTKNHCYIVEPFVFFGLNSDAPEVDFGIIITRR